MPRIPLAVFPPMRCDDNCGRCCGVVPCLESEYMAVVDYAAAHGIKPLDQGITCPWYQGGKCSVYPVRPLLCRVYGHAAEPALTCPLGYNVNSITPEAAKRLMRRAGYHKATKLLHNVLPEFAEDTPASFAAALRERRVEHARNGWSAGSLPTP